MTDPEPTGEGRWQGGRTLEGRTAIVTGAGRGIGREIAMVLAARGADLALAARSLDEIEAVAETVRSKYGRRALAVPTDVTDPAAVDRLVERSVTELGGIDILVNNSGIIESRPFLEVSEEDFDRVMDTNLRGTVLCCRAAGRVLVEQGSGKVINMASTYATRGVIGMSSYCASKAAILNLTRVLALEWARSGVQVNSVAPGYIESDMNTEVRADADLHQRILRSIPARRFGGGKEVGYLVAYLAGPESDFVTGESIVIDGGQLAKA
jgi:2-deoxy-D-gluconate 3-dehydrogenase